MAVVGQPKSVNLIKRGKDAEGKAVKMYIVPSELREYFKRNNGT